MKLRFSVPSAGMDHRNRADLIESAAPCHDSQVVGYYWGLNPPHLTVLTAKSEDYTTAAYFGTMALKLDNNMLLMLGFY